MKLRDLSNIRRTPEQVWAWVQDSEKFARWNDKIVSIRPAGPFEVGRIFTTEYSMRGKASTFTTTVTAIEAPRLLELRHDNPTGSVPSDLSVVERITLEADAAGTGTIVRKDITVMNDGAPWWARLIIGFITRFGRPAGEDKLKKLCEGAGAPLLTSAADE